MSTLQTIKFWLEPDQDIPQFKRLKWESAPVSISDLLLTGVHPWMGPDKHPTLLDEFVRRVNNNNVKLTELVSMGHGYDVTASSGYSWNNECRFQRTLKSIQEEIYFVDDLSYMELLAIAKARLRLRWSHDLARTLAKKSQPGFQSLRQFLKSKKHDMKLTSYDDVNRYDLGRVLNLSDFEHLDRLLVTEGIASPNFRRGAALREIADEHGRLRLVSEIRALSLSVITRSEQPHVCGTHVQWHVTRTGEALTFRPDIGTSTVKKLAAAEFAKRWRTDTGKLVFQTSLDRLSEIVEQGEGKPEFPTLNYAGAQYNSTATSGVEGSRIQAFTIGAHVTSKCNGDVLKNVLREYGVSTTGNKDELVAKIAKLAADLYKREREELDQFFENHGFVRIANTPSTKSTLPVMESAGVLRNLVLSMYVLRHLRGGSILEPGHENATYSIYELAMALVNGKMSLTGSLLRVA
jgi:hypothetical protein